jgi:uncharacterized protein YggE
MKWTGIFLLIAAFAVGQERPQLTAQPNTIIAGADGRFEAEPDLAILQFMIAAQDSTADAVFSRASKAAEQFRTALKQNGVDPKSAELSHYALQPMYDWKSPKHKIVGYRVTSNVTLQLKDFTKIAPLTQSLAGIEDTENQSVSYDLDDVTAAKQRAAEDAFRKARAYADTVAKAGGRNVTRLSYASVDVFDQVRIEPMQMRMRTMAAQAGAEPESPAQDFTPQKITVTAHVNAMFLLD